MNPIAWSAAFAVSGGLLTAFADAEPSQAAPSTDHSGIIIEHAWSRASFAGHAGVVSMTVTDTAAPDRLLAFATPIAEKAEAHESHAEGGMVTMRPLGALSIAPGRPLTFAPGGAHVMLIGLKRSTRAGDSFPLTLTFEHAAALTVQVHVEGLGARAGTASSMSGHGMDMAPAASPTKR